MTNLESEFTGKTLNDTTLRDGQSMDRARDRLRSLYITGKQEGALTSDNRFFWQGLDPRRFN